MGLVMKPESNWWYARVTIHKRRIPFPLKVKIRGRRPAKLSMAGDDAFEDSRAEATLAMQAKMSELLGSQGAEYHRAMYELLSGNKLDRNIMRMDQIERAWLALPADRSERYLARVLPVLRSFVAFAKAAGVRDMRDVTGTMAQMFIAGQKAGLRETTINSHVTFLRSVFSKLGPDAGCTKNPFDQVARRKEHTVHRKPLTIQEISDLIAHADDVVRGPIICGISTAMRRADSCRLRWESIDLDGGIIEVKASKTGKNVTIPILPLLRDELLSLDRSGPYVWPKAAEMFERNHTGITWRVKKAFQNAKIESLTPKVKGQRRNSIKDFHALKTTWITMALNAGVPMAMIQKVAGNASVRVVMENYYQPAKDDLKDRIGPAFAALNGVIVKSA